MNSFSTMVPPGGVGRPVVFCPEGHRAVGGGHATHPDVAGVSVTASVPIGVPTAPIGWQVIVHNASSSDIAVKAQAVCVG